MGIKKSQTKVIIIGAGPAGAAVSIFLTKACIPHVIIEKETFPRDKVCGDACSGKAVHVLRKANPGWLQEIFQQAAQFMPSYGIVFAAPNGKAMEIPFKPASLPGHAPGFTTPRLVFDNFLFHKLASPYATIYQQASLTNIQQNANNTVTATFLYKNETCEITAPLMVGADGDKSRVRKTLLQQSGLQKSYCVGLRAYYTGVTHMHPENFIELHFLSELLPGYFWIFPLPNGMINVGVGVLSETVRKKKINLREQMLNAIEHNPNISARFAHAKLEGKIEGWGLPMYTEKQPVSGNNFLLTGDAASLIDPFTGEGIGNAMISGMVAANAIEKSLLAEDFTAAFLKANYDDTLYRQMGEEFTISNTLQRLSKYPWLLNFVVSKVQKNHTLNKLISDMLADMDIRKQLRTPSFYAKILFNR